MQSVIVLGAQGRFGRAATLAFADAGWRVTEVARRWPAGQGAHPRLTLDVQDAAALSQACLGHDVIVNAVNPPYPAWADALPRLTAAVLAAAHTSGATVLLPGNVYNYGTDLPTVLREETPWVGATRKGALRITMEEAYAAAGVRTIVLRGGDFIEAAQSGNWFDSVITKSVARGRLTYPGPRDQVHAWAYLPDMARAAVALAERRAAFKTFETFGFAGYALTGAALAEQISAACRRPMRMGRFPWPILRAMALWSPLMREVLEMRYLWQRPHRIDGAKLAKALPDYRDTPPAQAFAAALSRHTLAS